MTMLDTGSMMEGCDSGTECEGEASGLPQNHADCRTLGDLLDTSYRLYGVREQMRQNLLEYKQNGRIWHEGIIGFEEDVIPALERAILAGHDMLLIGQMGQAKTRMVDTMAGRLLSPIPVIRGSITNDTPLDMPTAHLQALLDDTPLHENIPSMYISPQSAETIRNDGLQTRVDWTDGPSRSRFVMGTPDMAVKDLVGYVDAIKVVKRGVEMYNIESYSPGQLMQAKHGIFCIDELPVLDPRKQVALLSVLQEGRFMTGTYPVTFHPRTVMACTANPTDYTHAGRIIEPLLDRLKSHIHTRYPATTRDEIRIIIQEARIPKSSIAGPVLEILAGVVRSIRSSNLINQEKGVSVRMGIHGLELLIAEALRARNEMPSPRLLDFDCLEQVARFELLEMDDTIRNRVRTLRNIADSVIQQHCTSYLDNAEPQRLQKIRGQFSGRIFRVSQGMAWADYEEQLAGLDEMVPLVEETAVLIHGAPNPPEHIRLLAADIILRGLCGTTPRVLELRDSGYAAA